MDCDNAIGRRGTLGDCASSEEEAVLRWNQMNAEIKREKNLEREAEKWRLT